MREFVVRMANQPGRLAALTEALAACGVNIEALAVYGHDGEGTTRIIVKEPTTARRVLEEAALSFEEHPVLTAQMPHRPGELARLTRSLADSQVNIDALYVLHSNAGGVELAVAVDQPDSAVPHLEVKGGTLSE